MNRRQAALAAALLPVSASIVGCAGTGDLVDAKEARLSVVVGYLDMRQAPSNLQWVSIKAYGPGTDHFFKARVEDGVFFHVGVDPGPYQIDRFGGQGGIPLLTSRPFQYDWGTRGRNESAIRIERPGVYFVGAFEYVPHETGIFEAGKFSIRTVRSPSEREVLQRALKVIEGDSELRAYDLQIDRLRRRIAALAA